MRIKQYNIGIEPSSFYSGGFSGIDYLPGSDLPFFLWEYARKGREASGAGYIAERVLKEHQRFIERTNSTWLVPFLERMAKGESVDIEEIQSKHIELFGRPLEEIKD